MKKAAVIGLLLLAVWIAWGNRALMVQEYTVGSTELPEGFSGFRIAQISDLHNTRFGGENETLLRLLAETAPDIIVITGDLVDSRRTDFAVAEEFARKAVEIAPCYYVTGNHEARIAEYPLLEAALQEAGVTVLSDEAVTLTAGQDTLMLMGLDDRGGDYAGRLEKLAQQREGYTLLLCHKPDFFGDFVKQGFSLVFSGHVHGGQFRLPLIGGLFAPGQGFFPEYDGGVYTQDETTMVVSRGLGNSLFPFRVNNRPEIVLTILKKQ